MRIAHKGTRTDQTIFDHFLTQGRAAHHWHPVIRFNRNRYKTGLTDRIFSGRTRRNRSILTGTAQQFTVKPEKTPSLFPPQKSQTLKIGTLKVRAGPSVPKNTVYRVSVSGSQKIQRIRVRIRIRRIR